MARQVFQQKRWQGLSDYPKEGEADHYYYGESVDYRTDPQAVTLLPDAIKESGSVVTDLLKWADTSPSDLSVFSYGNTGNLYKRTSAGSWSKITQVASSHGNGLAYFTGDDYLYLAGDSTLNRYGPISGTPQYSADFLKAAGGVPLNTASITLASASSMYGTAADSASLSITGDLSLETYFKANSLPSVGNSMTLIGKWDESGSTRSYKLDLYGISGYFGSGSDGSLTVSSDTTEAPIDSACTGTSGTQSLSATNASFATNQVILIHQSQGTNAGQWERGVITGYTAGTITLGNNLINTYTSGAQVRVLKQYTNVTINTSKTYLSKAWNGTVGGIIGFLANGTVTVNGTISANALGFRGGAGGGDVVAGTQGEGTGGSGTVSISANGNGGGGGGLNGVGNFGGGSSGSGGNATSGTSGTPDTDNETCGTGGSSSGTADLTNMTFGGAAGGGAGISQAGVDRGYHGTGCTGGNGGGIVFLTATTMNCSSGLVTASGGDASNLVGGVNYGGGAAGGAGGSVLIKSQTATLGTNKIAVAGGQPLQNFSVAYAGAVGRIHLDYYTSYTGTTTPSLTAAQDNTLVTTSSTQARLGISDNGSSSEYLTKNLVSLTTGTWNRLSVTWTASTSTAIFYMNATNIGTATGTKTAIHDNASLLYVGSNKTSVVTNYFDGILNDMRIWSGVLSGSTIFTYNQVQLTGSEGGLKAYYKFNSAATDSTSNANNLTLYNSPTYTSDVPFSAATTRLDIDQSYTTTGSTYTLGTSISETSTNRITFTPNYDPQKSIDLNIGTKGTGNWTVTIHDAQNNVITSVTVNNATLASSGYYEFVYTTPWRIVIGKTYHVHVTSTVGDGTIVSSSLNDLSTGDFHTYYSFLVTDTAFHPIKAFLNKIVIGNERYVATWDGALYQANFIALPTQVHVRCFGFWREYIAIGTWREVTSGTPTIADWNSGSVYFWDGISQTYNFMIDVPEGQINAMFGTNSTLYMYVGYKGDLMAYQGSYATTSGGSQASKIKRIPLTGSSDFVEIYPGAMAMWRSLLYIGVAASLTSSTVKVGTYSWGTLNRLYPETMSYDYVLSTGTQGSSAKIGLVYPIGTTLLIGYQDGSSYGCDHVDFSNSPSSTGTLQTLIMDNNSIWNEEISQRLKASFLPLRSGESVNVKYKIDRATNWTSLTSPVSTVGATEAILDIPNGRGREYQYAVDLATSGSTSPTLLGLSALFDDGSEESQL